MICVNPRRPWSRHHGGMLKSGLFLPGHCPQRERREGPLVAMLAGAAAFLGVLLVSASLWLLLSLL